MFIVSLSYIQPLEKVNEFIPEHIDFLDKHYSLGHFQLSGPKEPRTGGVILATVDCRKTLDQILAEDPFHREGLARYEVTQMVPNRAAKALEFLLG